MNRARENLTEGTSNLFMLGTDGELVMVEEQGPIGADDT